MMLNDDYAREDVANRGVASKTVPSRRVGCVDSAGIRREPGRRASDWCRQHRCLHPGSRPVTGRAPVRDGATWGLRSGRGSALAEVWRQRAARALGHPPRGRGSDVSWPL